MAKSINKLRKPPTFSLGSKCKFINKKHTESTRYQYYAESNTTATQPLRYKQQPRGENKQKHQAKLQIRGISCN